MAVAFADAVTMAARARHTVSDYFAIYQMYLHGFCESKFAREMKSSGVHKSFLFKFLRLDKHK